MYEDFVAAAAARLNPMHSDFKDAWLNYILAELKAEYRRIAIGRNYDWLRDGNQARSLAEQVRNYRHHVPEPQYGVPAKWKPMFGSTSEHAIVVE